jgi:signal transduction histidine kinase
MPKPRRTPEERELLQLAAQLVPAFAAAHLERCWAGLRPGSFDGLPFLGPVPRSMWQRLVEAEINPVAVQPRGRGVIAHGHARLLRVVLDNLFGNAWKFSPSQDWIRTLGDRIVKLDIKGWGEAEGFGRIGDGDIEWPAVREALDEIGYTGWCTAEVQGGGREELADI